MKKFISTNIISLFLIINLISVNTYAENKTLTKAGDILQVAIPVSGLALTYIQHDYEGAKEFLASFFISNGMTHLIKLTTGKSSIGKRPNGKSKSFPSGHATSAFQGAFFLQQRYGAVYGVPAIGLAGLTGYSRVAGKYHHARDIVAGAVLSGIVAHFTVTKFNPQNTKINAVYSKDIIGVKMEFKI
jgi:membrane-associated phospholipid phosphatase